MCIRDSSGIAISFCEPEEKPYIRDIQKLIGKPIPVVSEHPFASMSAFAAQEIKQERPAPQPVQQNRQGQKPKKKRYFTGMNRSV